VTIVALRGKS